MITSSDTENVAILVPLLHGPGPQPEDVASLISVTIPSAMAVFEAKVTRQPGSPVTRLILGADTVVGIALIVVMTVAK